MMINHTFYRPIGYGVSILLVVVALLSGCQSGEPCPENLWTVSGAESSEEMRAIERGIQSACRQTDRAHIRPKLLMDSTRVHVTVYSAADMPPAKQNPNPDASGEWDPNSGMFSMNIKRASLLKMERCANHEMWHARLFFSGVVRTGASNNDSHHAKMENHGYSHTACRDTR